MRKLATLTSLALLLTAGVAAAQTTTTFDRPAVLTPDQCNELWRKAVTKGDTLGQADAAPDIANFAQIDNDFAQVDTNNDASIVEKEFEAACAKGVVYKAPRVKD